MIVDRRVQATDKWITSIKFWEVWNSLRNTLSIRDTFEPEWKVQNKYFCGYDELAISDPYEWVKREFECFVLKKYELSWTDYFIRDEVARWIGDNNLNSKYNFNLESKPENKAQDYVSPSLVNNLGANTLDSTPHHLTKRVYLEIIGSMVKQHYAIDPHSQEYIGLMNMLMDIQTHSNSNMTEKTLRKAIAATKEVIPSKN